MDLKSVPHNIVDYNIMEIQCGSKSLDQLYGSALSLKRNYRHSKGHNYFTLACLTLKMRALWPFEMSTTASRRYGLSSQNIRVVRFTMQPILGSCESDSVLAMVLTFSDVTNLQERFCCLRIQCASSSSIPLIP